MRLRLLLCILLASVEISLGHGAKGHPKDSPNTDVASVKKIGAAYQKSVAPIFKKSCFDCHSSSTRYPWYHKVPGIRSVIDDDIQEALKHLDLSDGFPFKGHGSPRADLEALSKVFKEGTMPPRRYRWMHPGSEITSEEKQVLDKWISTSCDLLRCNAE